MLKKKLRQKMKSKKQATTEVAFESFISYVTEPIFRPEITNHKSDIILKAKFL